MVGRSTSASMEGGGVRITSAMYALAWMVLHGTEESECREAGEALAEMILEAGERP